MNVALIDAPPPLDFLSMSIYHEDWRDVFLGSAQDGKPIKYDVYEMPVIPSDIASELDKNGYIDLILNSDHDMHFLVPKK